MFQAVPKGNAGEWLLTRTFVQRVEDFQAPSPSGGGIQLCSDNFPAALAGRLEKRSFSTTDIEKAPAAPRACHLGHKSNAAMVTEAGGNPVPRPVVFGVVRLKLVWGRVRNPDSTDGALQHVELQPSLRVRDSAKARLKPAEAHRAGGGWVCRLAHGLIMSKRSTTPKDQTWRIA